MEIVYLKNITTKTNYWLDGAQWKNEVTKEMAIYKNLQKLDEAYQRAK